MSTPLLMELFVGFVAATVALWFVVIAPQSGVAPAAQSAPGTALLRPALLQRLQRYVLGQGVVASLGLLALRLAVGLMMIHHGQDKLADPAGFAANYVVPLHLPFPLLMAQAAGYAEVLGSWLLILGVMAPLGALALIGTMAVAAYHHILTSGLNIYVLELVVLYLGASTALLLLGPGRFSFDAGIVAGLGADESGAATGAAVQTLTSPEAL
jgi:putative oxidoreductase